MKKYIVLEWIHGSGKTTIAKALAKELQSRGINAQYYHFPDEEDSLGKVIRSVVANKDLVHYREITGALYAAFANKFHIQTKDDDVIYVLDRHSVTTGLIFQESIPEAVRQALYGIGIQALKNDGISFYVSLDVETAKKRQEERNKQLRMTTWVRWDKGNDVFVAEKFHSLAKKYDEYLLPSIKKMDIPIYTVNNNTTIQACVQQIISLLPLHG